MKEIGAKEAAQRALREHRPVDRMHKPTVQIQPPKAAVEAQKFIAALPKKEQAAIETRARELVKDASVSVTAFAKLGGLARARKLTPERRQAIARLGAQARWPKKPE